MSQLIHPCLTLNRLQSLLVGRKNVKLLKYCFIYVKVHSNLRPGRPECLGAERQGHPDAERDLSGLRNPYHLQEPGKTHQAQAQDQVQVLPQM